MALKRRRKKRGIGHPGVSVEEVVTGSRPIEGVGTSTAGFVGLGRRHPVVLTLGLGLVALGVASVAARATRRSGSLIG